MQWNLCKRWININMQGTRFWDQKHALYGDCGEENKDDRVFSDNDAWCSILKCIWIHKHLLVAYGKRQRHPLSLLKALKNCPPEDKSLEDNWWWFSLLCVISLLFLPTFPVSPHYFYHVMTRNAENNRHDMKWNNNKSQKRSKWINALHLLRWII